MQYRILAGMLLSILAPLASFGQAVQVWQRQFSAGPMKDNLINQIITLHGQRIITAGALRQYLPSSSGGYNSIVNPELRAFDATGNPVRARLYAGQGGFGNVVVGVRGDLLLHRDSTDAAGAITVTYERTDSLGNRRWRQSLPDPWATTFHYPIVALPDGGMLGGFNADVSPAGYVGARIPEAKVVRLDSAGRVLWRHQYGGPYTQIGAIAVQVDGTYVLAGQHFRAVTPGPGYIVTDAWLQRIDLDGNPLGPAQTYGTLVDGEFVNDVRPTPNKGLLLTGSVSPNYYSNQPNRGWLVQLDSLGRVQWQVQMAGVQSFANRPLEGLFYQAWPLQDGSALVNGYRRTQLNYLSSYLARYVPTAAGTAAASWELYPTVPNTHAALAATGGLLTLAGRAYNTLPDGSYPGQLTRFSNAGTPYAPDYCRTPPVANAAYGLNPARDTIQLVDFSTAGPGYAQVVRWHWQLPGGRVLEGVLPPRQRVVPVPPPGTPVRLTVTNNLGCAATTTVYPWGLPTATQPARALAGQLTLAPNPASGRATLTLTGAGGGQPAATAQVLDALGRVVGPVQPLAWAGATATAVLNVAGLLAGVYVVRVQVGETTTAKRLVVQP